MIDTIYPHKYSNLYQRDTKGKLRIWWMEIENDYHRTVSGLNDGKKVISGWKKCEPKNIGKTNATTGEQQAIAECKALYDKKIALGWSFNVPESDAPAAFFEPMLCEEYDPNKIKFPVYTQPKLDGIRCIVSNTGMWSRNGKPIVSSPHIKAALQHVFDQNPNVVFDGELYNHDLKHDFNKISSLIKKTKPTPEDIIESSQMVEYHIYDMYIKDVLFEGRFFILNTDYNSPMIKVVATALVDNQSTLDAFYSCYMEDGFEGQIIRYNTAYENKRTKNLLKRKEMIDKEFEILEVLEGKGNWAGYAKKVRVKLENGESCGCGIAGNQAYLKEVLKNASSYVGKLAKVQFQGYTPDNSLRFPVVIELDRKDI